MTGSEKIFHQLLALYPAAHRRDYGTAMEQLFRDQCRDARREGNWGLAKLWLRVLPDVLHSSIQEHIAARKEKTMNERTPRLLAGVLVPVIAFVCVFMLITGASVIITFLLPESFRST